MDPLDLKTLKKLADTCRKAGIKSFKGHGIEFTLSDSEPTLRVRRKKASTKSSSTDTPFTSDSLTEDELLFWSSGAGIPDSPQQQTE